MEQLAEAGDFRGTARFQVIRRIGAGGMGVVYLAMDLERRAHVALKTLKTISGDAVLHLKNEFRALQDVTHTNLVSLGELIEEGGHWFFTMELVDGVDFLQWVRGVKSLSSQEGFSRTDALPSADSQGAVPARGSDGVPSSPAAVAAAGAGGKLDERRLREGMIQLARGLGALHGAGKIHRDVKPSNVMVSAKDGRVVLLDFGLVLDRVREGPWSDSAVVGTTAYMAPEQAASRPLGPEADWYAVGVLLYEALTGRLPFSGPPLHVLMEKQQSEPPPPSAIVDGLPADLGELCVALLRRDPRDRPTGRQVLERLHAEPAPDITASSGPPPFVGRDAEIAQLWSAFDQTAPGNSVAVMVRGESGVGKSYLVRRFLERLLHKHAGVVLLAGRCYERESVPYKAFDGIIDELTRFLASRPPAEVAALLPSHVALVAQVFPVLRRVEAIARAPRPSEQLDPQQLRTRVFAALRQLFALVSERHRIVVAIDDIQWTDSDSLALLRELLRPPGAPPLLLVATLRDTALAPTSATELAEALAFAGSVQDLILGSLSDEASDELVAKLAKRMGALRDVEMRAIADEARGHPLFIQELVQHVALGGAGHKPGLFRVDDAIVARVDRLDATSRQLVELVAIAGKPLHQDVIARAAAAPFDDFARRVAQLRIVNLVRIGGARRLDAVEPYHDRVREAVLGSMSPDKRQGLHERLALALEGAERADPETLAVHWKGAGKPEQAARYAILAAEQAAAAVAFRRAARLYELALALGVASADERRDLTIRMGDALANAGQGGEAARVYLSAVDGAPAPVQAELERRAAEQYLRAGYIDKGIEQARSVLARAGMNFPRNPRAALVSVLYHRARVRLHGLRFKEKHASECAPADLIRLDTFWSLTALGFVDTVVGADFTARSILDALRVGEPGRLARAMPGEGVYASQMSSLKSPRAYRLLDLADRLARQENSSHGVACATGCRGLVEFVYGHFRQGRELLERSAQLYREGCMGASWEIFICRMYALICMFYEGNLPELARRLPPLLVEAEDCGDLFTAVSVRVALEYYVTLAADQPREARRTVVESMKRWSQSGFQMQHRYALLTEAEIDLYEGAGGAAEKRFQEQWKALERSLLLHVRQQRIETFYARARSAIMAAGEAGADRKACYATAARFAKALAKENLEWATAFGLLTGAAVAAGRGDAGEALAMLARATRLFDGLDMKLHAAAARRRHGELLKGSEGEALIQQAEAWLTQAQVKNIPRMVALFAPGFGG